MFKFMQAGRVPPLMDTRVTKKRKLEDGTATDSAIDVEEYNYHPAKNAKAKFRSNPA
jgi:hypothetical protein